MPQKLTYTLYILKCYDKSQQNSERTDGKFGCGTELLLSNCYQFPIITISTIIYCFLFMFTYMCIYCEYVKINKQHSGHQVINEANNKSQNQQKNLKNKIEDG